MALFKILRGNSSKLIKSNGAINPETKWTDGYAYYCTDTHDFYIDHLDSKGTQVRSKLNAKEAEKLRTSRSIAVGGAVTSTATGFDGTSDITIPINSVKESYLTWGGKNFSSDFGPLDASLISRLGANRFAFIKKGVTIEQSRDNGASWAPYSDPTPLVGNLFLDKDNVGANEGFVIGGNTVYGADTSSYQLRITIQTDLAQVYTEIKKFAIYVTNPGGTGCWCSIDIIKKEDLDNNLDTWTNIVNQAQIDGWSGWNIIHPSTPFVTYGNHKSQYQKIRFTFGCKTSSTNVNYRGLTIRNIMAFGGMGWSTPSSMAKMGHIYDFDKNQNSFFPNSITQLKESGEIYSKGSLKVDGSSAFAGSLTANGATTINDRLTVTGNATFGTNGKNTITLDGKLKANAAATFNSALTAKAAANFDGQITTKNYVTINENYAQGPDINASVHNQDALVVYGLTDTDNLKVWEGAIIEKDTDIGGHLTVGQSITLSGDGVEYEVNASDIFGDSIPEDIPITRSASIIANNDIYTDNAIVGSEITAFAGMISPSIISTGEIVLTSYDADGNLQQLFSVNQTGNVIASKFTGNLIGNADTATKATAITWEYFE